MGNISINSCKKKYTCVNNITLRLIVKLTEKDIEKENGNESKNNSYKIWPFEWGTFVQGIRYIESHWKEFQSPL